MEMNENYIESICTELEFPKEAVTGMASAWKRVEEEPEALKVWQEWMERYENAGYESGEPASPVDFGAALAEIDLAAQKAGIHKYTAELLFFLCLTGHLKRLYEVRRIDLKIWHDSCMDLHWKLMECHKLYGIWGSFVAWWFPWFFEMRRFALGRLQFELVDFPAEYERTGRIKPQGMTKAINVHIPSCGRLNMEECHASYRMAAEFFADAFAGDEAAFVCESWLLFPPHREMLGDESRIVKFMSEYDIFRTADGDDDLWRIFDRMDVSDLELLPENTGMQRAYKAWLRGGKRAGIGEGIFFFPLPAGSCVKN